MSPALVRLALAGGRAGLTRLAVVFAGVCAGTLVLLAVAAATTAERRQEAVRDRLDGPVPAGIVTFEQRLPARPYTVWLASQEPLGGPTLRRLRVGGMGRGAPVPPGAGAIPAPGTMLVSPALARLLRSPAGRVHRLRFPDRVVGLLGRESVPGPSDLVALVGARPGPLQGQVEDVAGHLQPSTGASLVTSFERRSGIRGAAAGGLAGDDTPGEGVVFLLLLLPIAWWVGSCTRVLAWTGERRLASLRLAGASQGQLGWLAALEAALPALAGAATAYALAGAWYARAGEATSLLGRDAWRADLLPAAWQLALAPLAVVAASAYAARRQLRRLELSPVGVARGGPERPPSRSGLLPLALVVAIWLTLPGWVDDSGWSASALAAFAAVLIGVPLLAAVPLAVHRVAAALARRARSAPLVLAASRLAAHPYGPANALSAAVLAVVGVAAFAALAPLERPAASPGVERPGTSGADVEVWPKAAEPGLRGRLLALPGVDDVVGGRVAVPVLGPRGSVPLLTGGCARFGRVVSLPDLCAGGGVVADAGAGLVVGDRIGDGRGPGRLRIARVVPGGHLPHGSVFVPPALLRGSSRPVLGSPLLVDTDGSRAAEERVRGLVSGLAPVVTVAGRWEPVEPAGSSLSVGWAVAVLLALSAGSLAFGVIEGVAMRRRSLTLLSAAGVPRAALARAAALELGLPVAVATLLGVGVTLVLVEVGALLFGRTPALPSPLLLVLLAGVTVLAALAAGAAVAVQRRLLRIEELRSV